MTTLPLAIMAGAAVIGWLYSWRALERERHDPELDDLELRIGDLERRREEIYDKLRGSESVDLQEQDRNDLEIQAAHVLRDLDQLKENLSSGRSKPSAKKAAPSASKESETASGKGEGTFTRRHPLLAGFLLGGGMVALVAVLIIQAQREAKPDPQQPVPPMSADSGSGAQPPGAAQQPELPPFVAAEVEGLRAELVGGAEDAPVHGQIADLLLAGGRPIDAFEEAQLALGYDENNSQALYVVGIVRFMMGQAEPALATLDRALLADPKNAQAALMKGIFYLQMEDRESALLTWRAALTELGSDERIERLISLAEQGLSATEIMQAGPGS